MRVINGLCLLILAFVPCITAIIVAHPYNPITINEVHPTRLILTHPVEPEPTQEATTPIVSAIEVLDDAHFDAAVKHGTVVIEYQASWCGSCRLMAPAVDALAQRHPKIKFYRIDIDNNPKSVGRCDIEMVPTLVLFRRGVMVGSLIGGGKTDAQLDDFVLHGNGIAL